MGLVGEWKLVVETEPEEVRKEQVAEKTGWEVVKTGVWEARERWMGLGLQRRQLQWRSKQATKPNESPSSLLNLRS